MRTRGGNPRALSGPILPPCTLARFFSLTPFCFVFISAALRRDRPSLAPFTAATSPSWPAVPINWSNYSPGLLIIRAQRRLKFNKSSLPRVFWPAAIAGRNGLRVGRVRGHETSFDFREVWIENCCLKCGGDRQVGYIRNTKLVVFSLYPQDVEIPQTTLRSKFKLVNSPRIHPQPHTNSVTVLL